MAEGSTTSLPAIKDSKKEPETDFKPTFVFQLSSDDVINPDKPQFVCVYDFCTELSKYCETSVKQLDVNKDWLKLLLACSSHNYERFMWIHLTFQASNNLKLTWNQVRKRLQSKFDDPSRRTKLVQELETTRFIPEIQSIIVHNQKFTRIADELEYDTRNYYVNSLPEKIQIVLRSTMTYDESKNFYCNLQDIQQRAVVFTNADEGKFVFYSKVAHVALSLDHEKVNKSDCEFHLLAQHSTLECPDYTIVKYPYMDFNGVPGVPDLLNLTPSSSSEVVVPAAVARKPVTLPEMTVNTTQAHIKQENGTAIAKSADRRVAEQKKTSSNAIDPRLSKPVKIAIPQKQQQQQQQQPVITNAHKAATLNNPNASTKIAAAIPPPQQKAEAPRRVAALKTENSTSSINPSNSGTIPPSTAPKGITRPRSNSPQSSRIRSPSPKRHHRDPSFDRDSLSPVEVGCYIHGKHASHTTKECRQAQMVIPPRRSLSPPPPPPPPRSHERPAERKPNICIYCKLPFKPGHLSYCREVPPKRRR
ncbi:unnamed protein product [Mucor hiemalis]